MTWLQVDPVVATALEAGEPVVALESSLIAQGLPTPTNLETGRLLEATVRDAGAIPATVALLDGKLRVGLGGDELERLAGHGQEALKVSRRDLGVALAQGRVGGTTVAGTVIGAALSGIRVFATGGIGGVHRGDAQDVSADLATLSAYPVAVVAAGAKAILDLPRTLEALESAGVPVIGYGCDEFPAFYARSSGLALAARVDGAEEAARIMQAHWGLGLSEGIVFANPIPAVAALDRSELEGWIDRALHDAAAAEVSGKDLTPYLLERLARASGGRTLTANVALLEANARAAARIAVAHAALSRS